MIQCPVVFERKVFRLRLEKEIERIEDGHFNHQVDLDFKQTRRFMKNQARQEIRLRVLLPVNEVVIRASSKRIT